jgi:hypothetical protein
MESISEAFNKCFVSDFICSISRTIRDKNANTGRLFVAKNRNGPDGLVFPIFMDTSNVTIKVLAKVDTPVVTAAMKPNELASALRDKYKEFRIAKRQQPGGTDSGVTE